MKMLQKCILKERCIKSIRYSSGHITFKDNNDGTVTFYDVPSHFQDHRWSEDGYSKQETARILKMVKRRRLRMLSDSDIEK